MLLGFLLGLPAADPATVDTAHRLARLESEIALLRGSRDAAAIAALEGIRIDSLTQETIGQGTVEAGHDGKYFLRTTDGRWRVNVDGQIQVRYTTARRDSADDQWRGGFETRRARIELSGNVFDQDWRYRVRMAADRSDGSFVLEDAHLERRLGSGWSSRFGQFKAPFFHEHNLSSKRALAVDRSLVSNSFSQGRTQGAELAWAGDVTAFSVSLNDGFGGENISALQRDVDWALTARAELLAAGQWERFSDFTSAPDEEGLAVLVGGAAHVQKGESGTIDAEESLSSWTIDAAAEWPGAAVALAFVGRHMEEADTDQFGFCAQGGVYVTDDIEVLARYEWADADEVGADDLSIITIGANRYMRGHALKLTADAGYAMGSVADFFTFGGGGWRADEPGEDGQLVVRVQLQLLF